MKRFVTLLLVVSLCSGTALADVRTVNGYGAYSYVSDMALEGYVGDQVDKHIAAWTLDAYERNPNIVEAIALAASGGDPNCTRYGGAFLEQNEFFGKHLTGLAYLYALTHDEGLYQAANTLVEAIQAAQGKDGYMGVHAEGDRLGAKGNWDTWGHYHTMMGLYQWYHVTGDQRCMDMVLKAAEYIMNHFENRNYRTGSDVYVDLAITHMFALLHQETGDSRYLEEATRIIEKTWRFHGNWLNRALDGKPFYTRDDRSRWEVLHTIEALAPLYAATGTQDYYTALENIWWSIIETDRRSTGGFSAQEKAVGNPYAAGSIETCACVAWVSLSVDYLRLSKDAYVADELELSYFNAILGALMDDCRLVTYDTPMNGTIKSSVDELTFLYNSGSPDFTCCQANAARAVGELSQWSVLTDAQALYVNYYAPSTIQTRSPAGQSIILRVESDYPRASAIRITIDGLSEPETFTMNLRIPSWSTENALRINGKEQSGIFPGAYYPVAGKWQNGDVIELDLTMALHYWVGEDRFGSKTAVYYGPILLALDANYDHTAASKVSLTVEALENMTILDGTDRGAWLLFEVENGDGKTITLCDFASIDSGVTKNHVSWLNVIHEMNVIERSRGQTPVWLNGLK